MQKPVEGRCLSASKQVSLGEPPGCWDRPGCPWAQPLSGQPVPPTGAALVFLGRQRVGGHGGEVNAGGSPGTAAGPLVRHLLAAGGLRGPSLWLPHSHGPLATLAAKPHTQDDAVLAEAGTETQGPETQGTETRGQQGGAAAADRGPGAKSI